jgi:hypothetical protein
MLGVAPREIEQVTRTIASHIVMPQQARLRLAITRKPRNDRHHPFEAQKLLGIRPSPEVRSSLLEPVLRLVFPVLLIFWQTSQNAFRGVTTLT